MADVALSPERAREREREKIKKLINIYVVSEIRRKSGKTVLFVSKSDLPQHLKLK
jgi:hypothetical protein